MVAATRRVARWWPGALALGVASVLVSTTTVERLAGGGLAPVAVAAIVAGLVAAPAAVVELEAGAPSADRVGRISSGLAELWSLLLLGAALAPATRSAGLLGVAGVVVGWLAVVPVVRWLGAVPVLVLLALAGSIGAGAVSLTPLLAPPWTLLEPTWSTWGQWLPGALTGGLLLVAAGLGQWSVPAAPAAGRLPWATAGGALLLVLLVAVRRAAVWESSQATVDPASELVALLCVAAGVVAVCTRPGSGSWRVSVGGALATAWFAGPAWQTLPLWWSTLLPLGIAVQLGLLMRRVGRSRRLVVLPAVVVATAAGLLGWPGLPHTTWAAAAAALVVVVALWVSGIRAVEAT